MVESRAPTGNTVLQPYSSYSWRDYLATLTNDSCCAPDARVVLLPRCVVGPLSELGMWLNAPQRSLLQDTRVLTDTKMTDHLGIPGGLIESSSPLDKI